MYQAFSRARIEKAWLREASVKVRVSGEGLGTRLSTSNNNQAIESRLVIPIITCGCLCLTIAHVLPGWYASTTEWEVSLFILTMTCSMEEHFLQARDRSEDSPVSLTHFRDYCTKASVIILRMRTNYYENFASPILKFWLRPWSVCIQSCNEKFLLANMHLRRTVPV